jgi:hypothetical protein
MPQARNESMVARVIDAVEDCITLEDLIARSDATQMNFLRTELEICRALVRTATTAHVIGDQTGVWQARANAEAVHEIAAKFVLNLRNPEHREEIQSGLRKLRAVLDRLG